MLFNTQQTLKQIVTLASKELERADLFFGHGTDNSWDEACWLVETLVQRSGIDQINAEMALEEVVLNELQKLLIRRTKEKIPLAYLLNEAWFAGLPFYVDDQVIIPRSPIAELIKNRFKPLIADEPKRILDLCCGSGCIGLASAFEFPGAKIVLADLSTEALTVAAINKEKHGLNSRCTLQQSDLFTDLKGPFDLIVSNPPYVGEAEYMTLPYEYKHEPTMALVSERNGLEIPVGILRQAADYLTEDGILILEVGNSWQALADLYPKAPFLWLEFENGGEGILSLSYKQLREYGF
ncbi:50S ribosomal protein L3 N(5)-glutamine methyltransferase [Haliea sp. AH-315-K21]|uniref:50S ribosomal protein L3 N(5)-glutamine methyltransferase n=1 Tax=SAR86 cluster bacterium TaxID=2030880 RepID=A0A2A5CE64_9GAMM|nr:50S ribosomal protein L3 N(5)-glutamine methyltransferase [Haliea sp. AH-315-K21]MBN4075199.1 50S ribosomal protein L3 N(5)-glutamine methyltransferase [Gammaproteobacteria bacterium AH-315-E17]PCJ42149.1 MAG: 50S ribosomal protein L3 N(5)-glutamine methyltransferase [SAR86 cluster bacterium]